MAEQFYTILTKTGKAKIANANALGTKLNLTKFVLGDGNGSYYNPTEDQLNIKNKVWEGLINSISIDKDNPNWIVINTVIPATVGGFMIREAGVFDNEGNMIAIGKYPETYKPVVSEGSAKDLYINMIIEVSNTQNVTLKVDPTVILANKKDIEILSNRIDNIKFPVTSVNAKKGDIVLKAEDIKTEDNTTVAEEIKNIKTDMKDKDLKSFETDVLKKFEEVGNRTSILENSMFAVAGNVVDLQTSNAFGKTSGTSTSYTVTLTPAPSSYKDGMQITILPHIDNASNPTLNINSLGALSIVKQDGSVLNAGEIKANIPLSLVRVGSNFFIRSSSGLKFFKGGMLTNTIPKGYGGYVHIQDITIPTNFNVKELIVSVNWNNSNGQPFTGVAALSTSIGINNNFFTSTMQGDVSLTQKSDLVFTIKIALDVGFGIWDTQGNINYICIG